MRILQVLPHLSKGGAERVVVELSNALVASGHDVTLLLAFPVDPVLNQQSLDERVHIEFISARNLTRTLQYLRLLFWIVRNRKTLRTYDVIHCHLAQGLVFGFIVSMLRKTSHQKYPLLIATCHVVGVGVSRVPRIMNEKLSRFFDVFVLMAVDDKWRNFITHEARTNIQIIVNGISFNEAPSPDSKMPITDRQKTKQAYKKNVLTIGTISRLQAERKPWLFLEAFSEIQKSMDGEVHFILGGDGPERDSLTKLSENLDLNRNLSMPGMVQDPLTVLKNLDLYITLNVEETTGIAGLEAIFSGVPVFGIQLSPTYLRGKNDWIWSDQNPRVVGREIVKYLKDVAQLQRISKEQFYVAREKYSLDRMRDSYLDLYNTKK